MNPALKVLLVEDVVDKLNVLKECISGCLLAAQIRFDVCVEEDVVGARRKLRSDRYDLVVMDIQLPLRKGQTPERYAGASFIGEVHRSDLYIIPSCFVGFTEFEDGELWIRESSGDHIFDIVPYSRSSDVWRGRLYELMNAVVKRYQDRYLKPKNAVSLAVVCALESEFEAVRALPCDWQIAVRTEDCHTVWQGRLETRSESHTIVAAHALEPGMAASSALCAKLISEFRPDYLAMTGIAGGIRGQTNLGDVVAADVVWDYTSGKVVQKGKNQVFLPEPRTIDLSAIIKGQLSRLVGTKDFLSGIKEKFREVGDPPVHDLRVIFGPMFTGTSVIANAKFVEGLNDMHRKIKGIDMEAYSVACAAKYAGGISPTVIILKSVSDFADPDKNDDFHRYASFTSARVLYEWAIRFL